MLEIAKEKEELFSVDEINTEKINSNLIELFDKEKCSWVSSKVEEGESSIEEINIIKDFGENDEKELAYIVKHYVNAYINKIIEELLPALKFTFDEEGIKNLCGKINEYEHINSSNYDISKDWGITKELREKEAFKEYIKLLEGIEFDESRIIHQKYYLKKEDFKVVAVVEKCNKIDLEGEELSQYVERFRVAGGVYRYEGSIINKSTIMKIIKSNFKKYEISLCLMNTLKRDSEFRVEL